MTPLNGDVIDRCPESTSGVDTSAAGETDADDDPPCLWTSRDLSSGEGTSSTIDNFSY